jgi:hypothetical protein
VKKKVGALTAIAMGVSFVVILNVCKWFFADAGQLFGALVGGGLGALAINYLYKHPIG